MSSSRDGVGHGCGVNDLGAVDDRRNDFCLGRETSRGDEGSHCCVCH